MAKLANPQPLVTIGWYVDGKLVDTHTLRADRAVQAIAGKQAYSEARHATPGYPGLRRTLAAQDAALAVLLSAAA